MPILKGDKRFWAPIFIGAGLTICFLGVSFTVVNLGVGIFDIIVGLAFLAGC